MTRDTGQRADTASKVDPASGEHHGSYGAAVKHTPGPWRLGKRENSLRHIDSGNWYSLAHVHVEVQGESDEEGIANARLIAAAPDLLEVLREIIADGVHCDVVPHLHRKAVAALAKATGESA